MIIQVPAKHPLHLLIMLNLHLWWVYWGSRVQERLVQGRSSITTGWRSTDTRLGPIYSQLGPGTGEIKGSGTTTRCLHTGLSYSEDDEFARPVRPPGCTMGRSTFLGLKFGFSYPGTQGVIKKPVSHCTPCVTHGKKRLLVQWDETPNACRKVMKRKRVLFWTHYSWQWCPIKRNPLHIPCSDLKIAAVAFKSSWARKEGKWGFNFFSALSASSGQGVTSNHLPWVMMKSTPKPCWQTLACWPWGLLASGTFEYWSCWSLGTLAMGACGIHCWP